MTPTANLIAPEHARADVQLRMSQRRPPHKPLRLLGNGLWTFARWGRSTKGSQPASVRCDSDSRWH
jgi:hypothetical protein